MGQTASNNQRIAKNATMLYIRMFISMAISFYTSRVVLKALGVSDFGIYNVVGGFVVLVNMISGSLSGATSRFLTYTLGEHDDKKLQRTFSTALLIHIGLSILFIVLAETVGLWFVNTQIVIPNERMAAANWVYQSAIVSTVLSITQVPYNSLITSHEHFGIFAVIDIINSCLKLSIALIVLYSVADHLILYSILYAVVAIAVMLFYRFYCICHFPESHLQKVFDRSLFKDMLGFTGWNLFGDTTLTFAQQGVNVVLNRFFGTLINAANGVALQVQAVLYAFIGNITAAFSPQIIKQYADKNYKRVNDLVCVGAKFSSLCTLLISIPIFVKMDFLMNLWLDRVPAGSVIICQILLVKNFFNSFNPLTYKAIMASGKVKYVNIYSGIDYILSLAAIYIIVYFTRSYVYAYIFNLLTPIASCGIYLYLLQNYMPEFNISNYVRRIILPCAVIGFISLILSSLISKCSTNEVLSLLSAVAMSTLSIMLTSLLCVFNKAERLFIINLLKVKVKRV